MSSKNQFPAKSMTQSYFRPGIYKQNDLSTIQTQHSSCFTENDYHEDGEVGLENDLLIKIKEQRMKIEELTYLYQKTEEQLRKEEEKTKKHELMLANTDELKTFKLKYLSLTKDFEQLFNQKTHLEQKNQKLDEALQQLTKEHQRMLKQTQLQKIRKQEDLNQEVNKFYELMKDKDDEVRKNLNVYEIKEKEFIEQISSLNSIIEEMKNDIAEMRRNAEAEIEKTTGELVKKEGAIDKMKSAMENVKEENSMLRTELQNLQNHFQMKEQDWLEAQDELIFEVNNMKRKYNDSETRFNQCKYECQKLQEKNTNAQQTIMALKESLRSVEEQAASALDQMAHSYEQKLMQYKNQTEELKESVQELLEVKNIFNKENQLLKEKINKEIEQKRKRNLMMREELREIQKMEHSVKRVL